MARRWITVGTVFIARLARNARRARDAKVRTANPVSPVKRSVNPVKANATVTVVMGRKR